LAVKSEAIYSQYLAPMPQWAQVTAILAFFAPVALLQAWLAPRLLGVRPLGPAERAEFPLDRGNAGGI
jgi:hypothetical protein